VNLRGVGPAARVAVIVPCFNDGATLADAVASVDAQEPCELVVVDDGSDDPATLATLNALGERGVRVVRRLNGGPAAARMTGVAATSAPYVLALDADDLVAEGALAALADALDADATRALAWGDVATFGDVVAYRQGPRVLDPWLITYLNEFVGAGTLVRRDCLVEVAGWQLREGFESWDLWMSFCERAWSGVYVPGLVLRYRLHGPRRLAEADGRWERHYAVLRERHRPLFEHRGANWRASRAPWRLKLLLPVLAAIPLVSAHARHRLGSALSHPGAPLRIRLRRASSGLALPRSEGGSAA